MVNGITPYSHTGSDTSICKSYFGTAPNGSEEGAETQAVLMSVFRTLKQRGHNPISAVVDAVRVHLQTGKLPPLPEPIAENG